jgi:hypothetical protein
MTAARPRRLVAGLALAAAAPAACAGYVVHPGPEGSGTLRIERAGRSVEAPKTEPGQEGFEQARVSADGRTVGWVASTPNCCTSYPLPTVLVLYRGGKVIGRFDEPPAIWHWAFVPGRDEVVTQQAFPHGPEHFTFTRLRIAGGRTLATWRCSQDEPVPPPRPAWTRAIEVDCPAYVPPAADEPASAAR